MDVQRLKEIVKEQEKKLACNCDLDNWQKNVNTGHSWVCRIHKTALSLYRQEKGLGT